MSQSLLKKMSSKALAKPALMQVEQLETRDDEEPRASIKLWKPDMIVGTLQISSKDLLIAKADSAAGLVFGVPHTHLHNKPLTQ